MVNHFWQSVDAILDDVRVTETIVWCYTINLKTIIFQFSKNYDKNGRPNQSLRKETVTLRLLSWVFDTDRVCHVWCNF